MRVEELKRRIQFEKEGDPLALLNVVNNSCTVELHGCA